MKIDISTPALLFPAISLLLLAYTNRFLAIASLVRHLHAKYVETNNPLIITQIKFLRTRLKYIRNMQAFAIISLFLCVFCMFLVFAQQQIGAQYLFACSLISMLFSLGTSMIEIILSIRAIDVQLKDVEMETKNKKRIFKAN